MEYYYILKEATITDEQALSTGAYIFKCSVILSIDPDFGEGPFHTVKELKKKSEIFNHLKQDDPKRAEQIFYERNINSVPKLLVVPKGTGFDMNVINMFLHATKGRVKNKNVTGVHFYDKEKVKIVEITEVNDITKVFKARIEYFDTNTDKWIEKKSPSTFFPAQWNLTQLLYECDFAYKQLDKKNIVDGIYKSKTLSNIDVEIFIKNKQVVTIYPTI